MLENSNVHIFIHLDSAVSFAVDASRDEATHVLERDS